MLVLLLAIVIAVFRNSPTSRAMIVVSSISMLVLLDFLAGLRGDLTIAGAGKTVILSAAILWYFYFEKNVVAYYRTTPIGLGK